MPVRAVDLEPPAILAQEDGEPTAPEGPSLIRSWEELFCCLFLLNDLGVGGDLVPDDRNDPSPVAPPDLVCGDLTEALPSVGQEAHHLISVEGLTGPHENRVGVGASCSRTKSAEHCKCELDADGSTSTKRICRRG